jgi:hypothetical protein
MGKQVTFHAYPGPTNGGAGNIPVYPRPTNGETGNIPRLFRTSQLGKQVTFHAYPGPTNGETDNITRIQDQPMRKQVTFHVYSGPTNGEAGNIPRLFKTNQWGKQVTLHAWLSMQYQPKGEQVTLAATNR